MVNRNYSILSSDEFGRVNIKSFCCPKCNRMENLQLFIPVDTVKADLNNGFMTCDPSGEIPGGLCYTSHSTIGHYYARPHSTVFVRCMYCGWTLEEELFLRCYVQRELLRAWLTTISKSGEQLYIDNKKAVFNAEEDTVSCKNITINISTTVSILWPGRHALIKNVIVECSSPPAEGKISYRGSGISLEQLIKQNYG